MAERRTLVSVDLDDVACYHQIHDLPPPGAGARGLVLERCLPRFLDLFAALGVRATFFVIGRDLERDLAAGGRGAALLRRALAAGHELANHSFEHAYDLVRWTPAAMRADLSACDGLLRRLGAEPQGFRAPGYTHDATLLRQVRALGYRYDSSSLPSPPYYLAKLGALAALRVHGRRSRSLAEGARAFLGKAAPHRRDDVDLWELPIGVATPLRLPLVGTFLLSGPRALADRLYAAALRKDDLHLELHGIDLADPDGDAFAPALVRAQPELRVPLADKTDRLAALLRARGPTTLLRDVAV
jgi:peptidoglycan/xylan/chitin deacetylase (PgdA/CDA1 family)